MAGSRFHKLGTIFSRTSGLLKTGAMKEETKPIWFTVYEAFPPQVEPNKKRDMPKDTKLINILYPEDIIRARFYREYGSPGLIDMINVSAKQKSLSQVFIERYIMIGKENQGKMNEDEIFKATESALLAEGVQLRPYRKMQSRDQTRELNVDISNVLSEN